MKKSNIKSGSAVTVYELKGDKLQELEKAEHRIYFPGGYVGVTRTSEGKYWAHVGIQKEEDRHEGRGVGSVLDSRIDFNYKRGISEGIPKIKYIEDVQHLAVLIEVSE
jgi:hypothetical protein